MLLMNIILSEYRIDPKFYKNQSEFSEKFNFRKITAQLFYLSIDVNNLPLYLSIFK